MNFRIHKEIPPFVMIDRSILLDPELSIEAKGLYAYIIASGEAISSTNAPILNHAIQELLGRGLLEQGYET